MEYFTNLKVRKYLCKIYTKNLNSENIFHIVLCIFHIVPCDYLFILISHSYSCCCQVLSTRTQITQKKKNISHKYTNLVGMRILANNVF